MPIGFLERYDDSRGFGFLRSESEPVEDVFCHVSEFNRAGVQHPQVGIGVVYQIIEKRGKTCAVDLEVLRAWQTDSNPSE